MAIFHYTIKVIGRNKGRSIIAAAAYQSASRMLDEESSVIHDYNRKKGVVYTEIMLCQNAPPEYKDRDVLWRAVQKVERNHNAQLARALEFSLPVELPWEKQLELTRQYIWDQFVSKGMCADMAFHYKETNKNPNPHVHVLLTMRGINPDGTWQQKEKKDYMLDENGERIPEIDPKTGEQKIGARGRRIWKRTVVKTNDWSSRDLAEKWRAAWAEAVNQKLGEIGSESRVDHRSYKRRGIEKIPTIHEGHYARQIEEQGGFSWRMEENREIRRINDEMETLNQEIRDAGAELSELKLRKEVLNERYRKFVQRRRDTESGRAAAAGEGRAVPEISTGSKGIQKAGNAKPKPEEPDSGIAEAPKRAARI